MAKINLIKKISLNLSRRNTVNYTATADTLHVDVHVVRIVGAKHTCLLHSFNCLVNCSFSGQSNRRGEIFKATGLSILYVQQFVSNSHLLLFHRTQRSFVKLGNATNWDSSGYFEVNIDVCKLG